MKYSLTLNLLEHLLVCGASVAISALFAPYGQGLKRSLREMERQIETCPHDFSAYSKETVSATLSRLRKKGAVAVSGPKRKTLWFITARGKAHFQNMKVEKELPAEDGKVRLVVYDIPEDMKSQRVWLRNRLVACEYDYLQKSVWTGTRPLPKKLREELKERKILPYVHVVGLEGFVNRSRA